MCLGFALSGPAWSGLDQPRPPQPGPAHPSPAQTGPGLPRPSSEQPSRTLAAPVLRFRYAGQGWSGRVQKIGFQVSIKFFIKKLENLAQKLGFHVFLAFFQKKQ
jgi:hypothetical protein